jgi:cell division septation protein DedD
MSKDFYPFIPRSSEARRRLRKLRLRRLFYTFGALCIFGSGFLLGLEWEEPNAALRQAASQQRYQLEAAPIPPVVTLPPPAELLTLSWGPQSIPLSEPVSLASPDAEADQMLAATASPQVSTSMLSSAATTTPPHHQDQTPVNVHTEPVPRPDTHKPTAIKPDVITKESPKPQPSSRPYLVQVGAFQNEANARGTVAKLRSRGYEPFIRTVPHGQSSILHRVFIDRTHDKAQALAAAKAFEATEKMDALVMLADSLSGNRQPTSR